MFAKQIKGEVNGKIFPSLRRSQNGSIVIHEDTTIIWWPEMEKGLEFTKNVPSAIVGAITGRWPASNRSEVGFIPCNFHFDEGKIIITKAETADTCWCLATITKTGNAISYATTRGLTALTTEDYMIIFFPVENLGEAKMPCHGMSKAQIRTDIQRFFF